MAYYQQQAPQTYSAPPQQGYPAPQQGYAPQQQGYAPQQPQTYQQQQPYAPPPHTPQEGGSSENLLRRQESTAAVKLRKHDVSKREVFLFKNFDIDTLLDIEGLGPLKYGWQFNVETLVSCWTVFNSISTIMIILTNFRRGVDNDRRNEYGREKFDVMMDIITYFPLVYFLLIILLFNNYYSESMFYAYLKRCAIVDYPGTARVRYLFTHVLPLLFIVGTLAYLVVVLIMFIQFKATVGVMLIFFNNLTIGVGLSWYRQQSIESKFVSLSNFIQAFPDRDEQYGNMDEQSLHSASDYLQNLVLTEAEEPSYTGTMRNFYWESKNYTLMQRLLRHGLVFFAVIAMSGACVGYFVVLSGLDRKAIWTNELNPCISVCTQVAANSGNWTASTCATCTCLCQQATGYKGESVFETCSDYGSNALCSAEEQPMCPADEKTCEALTPSFTKA